MHARGGAPRGAGAGRCAGARPRVGRVVGGGRVRGVPVLGRRVVGGAEACVARNCVSKRCGSQTGSVECAAHRNACLCSGGGAGRSGSGGGRATGGSGRGPLHSGGRTGVGAGSPTGLGGPGLPLRGRRRCGAVPAPEPRGPAETWESEDDDEGPEEAEGTDGWARMEEAESNGSNGNGVYEPSEARHRQRPESSAEAFRDLALWVAGGLGDLRRRDRKGADQHTSRTARVKPPPRGERIVVSLAALIEIAWTPLQLLGSVTFLVLYVQSTYAPAPPFGWRHLTEVFLCVIFAMDAFLRLGISRNWLKRLLTPLFLIDVLTWAPSLVELVVMLVRGAPAVAPTLALGWFDLRWLRMFRALAVLRRLTLAGELRTVHLASVGQFNAFLAKVAQARLVQLAGTILVLLFTSACVVQAIEGIPWVDALYFCTTTLTTVGFGDLAPVTPLGKAAVMGIMAVGVVLIPVQASQLYATWSSRRMRLGTLPRSGEPRVIVSTRLSDVRGFSDFFTEFFHEIQAGRRFHARDKRYDMSDLSGMIPRLAEAGLDLGRALRLVVVCNKPTQFEFRAFQELHARRLSFVEGSVLSEADLDMLQVQSATAVLLLADRFASNPTVEDQSLLFQVWAIKQYTSEVPVFVQTMEQRTCDQIRQFLDPERDTAVSFQELRFILLSLTTLCPGASTLLGNLCRSNEPSNPLHKVKQRSGRLSGLRWLREYADGAKQRLLTAPLNESYNGVQFVEMAEFILRERGVQVIGIASAPPLDAVLLNPAQLTLRGDEFAILIARSEDDALAACSLPFVKKEKPKGDKDGKADDKAMERERERERERRRRARARRSEEGDEDEKPTMIVAPPVSIAGLTDDPLPATPEEEETSMQQQDREKAIRTLRRLSLETETGQKAVLGTEDSADLTVAEEVKQLKKDLAGAQIDPIIVDALLEDIEEDQSMRRAAVRSKVGLTDHVIVAGHVESILPFARTLRECSPAGEPHILVLAPALPADIVAGLEDLGNVTVLRGHPTKPSDLTRASVSKARGTIFLSATRRVTTGSSSTFGNTAWRQTVLADGDALLTCYGVGRAMVKANAVAELCYTSSVRFLQPGTLLSVREESFEPYDPADPAVGGARRRRDEGEKPRVSWRVKQAMERGGAQEGLASWQVNPFFVSGRVTVPAVLDAICVQAAFNQGMVMDVMEELAGSGPEFGGSLLRCVEVPEAQVGKTYGELAAYMLLRRRMVPLGLYRKKLENTEWVLPYVCTNPPTDTVVVESDRVFVLRERRGAWIF
ncbi:unnamed protein product [Pedinophyceae sp. YPF-701]|nr:unnamed protein product [Pedinophyceae sp. YPF-701]